MNKTMNLRTRELLTNGSIGVLWIILGLMQVLNANKTIILIVSMVSLIMTIISISSNFVKTEVQDERARHNMDSARSLVCELFGLGIIVCLIMSTTKGKTIDDIKIVLSFLLGIGYFCKYVLFVIFEKEGL